MNYMRRLILVLLGVSLLVHPQLATATPIVREDDPTGIEEVAIVLGVLGAGWAGIQTVIGVRAFAYARADKIARVDPPQTLPLDLDNLKLKGGWFTSSTEAEAPAVGRKGSELTTKAVAAIGLPNGSAIVTFPTQILGEQAGASYFGVGLATAGLARDLQKVCMPMPCQPNPLGSVTAQASSTPLELQGSYVLNFIDLFVDPLSGNSTVAFTRDVWVTPDRDLQSLTDADFNAPSDAIYIARAVDAAVTLHASGPSGPFLSFEGDVLDASDFTPITFENGLLSTHLLGPKTETFSLTALIPDEISAITLFDISNDSVQTEAVAVAEPSTWLLLGLGWVGLMLTRRRGSSPANGRSATPLRALEFA